ncbi:MAG: VWA domain-containing protein [Kiritimatiellae bacterium]|jgi:Ca-activated chloride channel family protein|nr:VWA domain-containing protein [Kiritimatiellia bacterium]
MIFKAPWLFVLLLFLPLIYRLLVYAEERARDAVRTLRGSSDLDQVQPGKIRIALKLGAILMMIVALAQPAWNPHSIPAGVKGRDLVIAVDISRSMLAEDVYPNRLEATRFVLLEALGSMRGQRIGVITFAGSSSVRVPLTHDHNFVRYILERISSADADVGSTSLQAAIEKALDIVLDESERGKQDLIIFTDGEDHISNVDKVVEELRNWGARVLIIGLGDPVEGAKVPAISGDDKWMSYKGQDVVSRLDEQTLNRLAAESPGITYYPARTKPFDLMTLYRNMLIETEELEIGDASQMVYDEGYMYFVALALLFFLISFKRRLHVSLALLILMCGCSQRMDNSDAEYQSRFDQGRSSWAEAQSVIEANPLLGLEILSAARESFLLAAILRSGDMPVAEQIAGVSAQIHAIEKRVQEEQREDEELQQRLEKAVELLRELTEKEGQLTSQGQKLMRRRPPAPESEKKESAIAVSSQQVDVTEGTQAVLAAVKSMQTKVRQMLAAAFNDQDKPVTTEFDEVADLLSSAGVSQSDVKGQLVSEKMNWVKANSSLLTATRKMQEALQLLTDQSNDESDSEDSDEGDMEDWDYEDDMEWSESNEATSLSMPIRSQNFNSALNSRNMPIPNYSAEEIMAEEEANQMKREQQNSSRAGAKVEKNW